VLVNRARLDLGGSALVLVLPRFAVDEGLEGREEEKSNDCSGAGNNRIGGSANQVGRLGQEIGQRRGDQDPRGESHERMQPVAQAHGCGATEQRGKEGQNRKGDEHVEPDLIRHGRRWARQPAATLKFVVHDGMTRTGALVRANQPWGDAQLAELYDAFVFDGDLSLYLELARAQGQRVLEIACGSGRVLTPLTRAGFEVVGVDISPHMLALAQAKLDTMPGGQARLIQADMRDFRLDHADFDLAIVAVKSFAYLTEPDDQLRCLASIQAHLRTGGLLAIDFMHPLPEWVGAVPGTMRDDLLQRVPARGYTLSRVESVVSTDLTRQVRIIRSAYEVIDDSGSIVTKRYVEWPYRWTYRFEAEHLLARAGLTVEAVYGGYQREPFMSTSRAMVFLARKTATRP